PPLAGPPHRPPRGAPAPAPPSHRARRAGAGGGRHLESPAASRVGSAPFPGSTPMRPHPSAGPATVVDFTAFSSLHPHEVATSPVQRPAPREAVRGPDLRPPQRGARGLRP